MTREDIERMFSYQVADAALIELGLPKPRYYSADKYTIIHTGFDIINYSIGELIEMLPENVAKRDEIPSTLNVSLMNGEWCVQYADFLGTDFVFCNTELIDALYAMILQLKEKGVI